MGMLHRVALGVGVASVLISVFSGCGGGGENAPGPLNPGNFGGGSAGGGNDAKMAAATEEYKKCRAEEDKENANNERIQRCYQRWIDEYKDVADQGQLTYARRMAQKHPEEPNKTEPAVPKTTEKPPIVIDTQDHPPPKQEQKENPFPPQTVGYEECWKGAPLTGNYVTDYNNLVARCGKPTGMLPYSRVMEGELSDQHKGDVYTVKLLGGGCYRFFAVAGGSIKDIDIGLATMEDKMLAADKYTQPVAIIEWAKPVCVENDVMFKFIVARDGGGQGGYGFGIWFKPAAS